MPGIRLELISIRRSVFWGWPLFLFFGIIEKRDFKERKMTLIDLSYEILSYTLGIDKSLVKKIRKINKFDEEEQSILENYTIFGKKIF